MDFEKLNRIIGYDKLTLEEKIRRAVRAAKPDIVSSQGAAPATGAICVNKTKAFPGLRMKPLAAKSGAHNFHGIDGTYAARPAVNWFKTSTSGYLSGRLPFGRTHAVPAHCRPPISQEQT